MPTVYSPPVSTYVALATTTASGGETSVTFSSIPASYRDLVLVISPIVASGTHGGRLRFNADSGSNYSFVQMLGDGSSATSSSGTGNGLQVWTATTTVSQTIFQIMDYSATDKHKTVLYRQDDPNSRTRAVAERWANTSAVTSIELNLQGVAFAAGSTFSLYGIEA